MTLEKSGILTWNEENINNAPNKVGVYIMRSSSADGFVVGGDATGNLKEALLKAYKENIANVNFFEWQETATLEEAQKLYERIKHNG
ncbi:MAG: hypothetical protein AAB367_03890 [Patescibacteria group bacterium]